MSVSEDRTVQPSPTTPAPVSGIADPAPLGLAAFALTTFLLSAKNAGWMSHCHRQRVARLCLRLRRTRPAAAPACGSSATGTCSARPAFGTYGAFWIGLGLWVLLVANPARRGHQADHAGGNGHVAQPRPRLDPARVRHLHHVRADPDHPGEHGRVPRLPLPVGSPSIILAIGNFNAGAAAAPHRQRSRSAATSA